ncbi:hypothetical protein BD289DRAFT_217402 [Coniella lustricola]|uniref:Zn(2)-C6 fungal-type domain-containing protein n=1 Tax=Coniella lustricola TaxID=2025994 RepID=A0A2T3ABC2_9PEZI|nr:hypothetical protein BD289DRAFT_217402 [Coniella lustricola]
MVGVPRSKGCSLCVKRRIKCDQVRPACGNCIKYGAECPGYDKNRKFVSGKHTIRGRGNQEQQHKQGLVMPPDTQTSTSPVSPDSTTDTSQLEARNDSFSLDASGSFVALAYHQQQQQPQQPPAHIRKLAVPVALRDDPVPLVYGLMEQLFTVQKRDEAVYNAPWFTSILSHIGRVSLLDGAMTSLLLQLVGKAKGDSMKVYRSRELYSWVLASLQKALNHPVVWKSAETLAATIICCIFELFAGTNNALTWMVHATGINRLVQQRGPASFSANSFDISLLRGVRPIIISKAIFAGHDCFLDRPKWRRISEQLTLNWGDNPASVTHPKKDIVQWAMLPHQDPFYVLHAKMPRVIRIGYSVRREMKRGIEPNAEQVDELRSKAAQLRTSLLAWFTRAKQMDAFADPVESPSSDPTSPFATVLDFRDQWEGSIVLAYWADLLILQECLNQCAEPGASKPFEKANRQLANDILRAMVQVGAGFMGPYRVGYPLRVAIDFVDEHTQHWTLTMVDKYSEHYAAMSSKVYPSNPLIGETDAKDEESIADAAAEVMPSLSLQ